MNVTYKSMKWVLCAAVLALFVSAACGATFGTVVPIGGQASDIALDEPRGVLYVANFTANRIDVVSLADKQIRKSINIAAQPSSLALSPNGQWLVVAHYGNFASPSSPANALTILNLGSNNKQTFALGFPPLGVAFGADNRALVVTTNDFILLEPGSGSTQVLNTIEGVTAQTLPVAPPNFPPQIVAASMAASRDGLRIYGLADTFYFSYDVGTGAHYDPGLYRYPAAGTSRGQCGGRWRLFCRRLGYFLGRQRLF